MGKLGRAEGRRPLRSPAEAPPRATREPLPVPSCAARATRRRHVEHPAQLVERDLDAGPHRETDAREHHAVRSTPRPRAPEQHRPMPRLDELPRRVAGRLSHRLALDTKRPRPPAPLPERAREAAQRLRPNEGVPGDLEDGGDRALQFEPLAPCNELRDGASKPPPGDPAPRSMAGRGGRPRPPAVPTVDTAFASGGARRAGGGVRDSHVESVRHRIRPLRTRKGRGAPRRRGARRSRRREAPAYVGGGAGASTRGRRASSTRSAASSSAPGTPS